MDVQIGCRPPLPHEMPRECGRCDKAPVIVRNGYFYCTGCGVALPLMAVPGRKEERVAPITDEFVVTTFLKRVKPHYPDAVLVIAEDYAIYWDARCPTAPVMRAQSPRDLTEDLYAYNYELAVFLPENRPST